MFCFFPGDLDLDLDLSYLLTDGVLSMLSSSGITAILPEFYPESTIDLK
jgi:hypothetical protein